MAGAILQLVANNGPQNVWIEHDPQITFFKILYRRHTPFATEMIPLRFNGPLNFSTESSAKILRHADLLHRVFIVFDIPELEAMFMNSKEDDLLQLVRSTTFTDKKFSENILGYTSNGVVELDQILNLIDDTINQYDTEEISRLNIAQTLETFSTPVDANNMTNTSVADVCGQSLDTEIMPTKKILGSYLSESDEFINLKMELIEKWIGHKKEYLPIYELVKFTYLQNKTFFATTPIYSDEVDDIFMNILPNNQTLDYDFGPNFHDILNTFNTIITGLKSLATTVPTVAIKVFELGNKNINIYNNANPSILKQTYYPTVIDPNFTTNFLLNFNNSEKIIEDINFLPIDYFDSRDQIYQNSQSNKYASFFNNNAIAMFANIKNSTDILFESYREKLFRSTDTLFFRNSAPLSSIYSYIAPEEPYHDSQINRIANVMNTNIWFFFFFKYLDSLNETNLAEYVANNFIISPPCTTFIKNMISLLKINIEYFMYEISYMMNDLYATSPSTNPADTMKNYVPVSYDGTIKGNINVRTDLLAVTIIYHRNHVPTILEIFQYIYYFIDNISVHRINNYLNVRTGAIDPQELLLARVLVKLFYYNIFKYFMDVYDNLKFEAPANFSLDAFNSTDNRIMQKYAIYFLTGQRMVGDDMYQGYAQKSLHQVLPQMEFYFVAEMIGIREIQKFYHNVLFNTKLISDQAGDFTAKLVEDITKNILRMDDDYKINLDAIALQKDGTRIYWEELYQHNAKVGRPDNLYYSTFNLDRYYGEPYLSTDFESRDFGYVNAPIDGPINPPTIPYGIDPKYYNNNQSISDFGPIPVDNHGVQAFAPIYWSSDSQNIGPRYQNRSSDFDYRRLRESNIDSVDIIFGGRTTIASSDESGIINGEKNFKLYEIDYFRIKHKIFYSNGIIIPSQTKFVDEYQLNLLKLVKLNEKLLLDYPLNDKFLVHWIYLTVFYLLKHTDPKISYDSYLHEFDFMKKNPTFTEVLDIYLIEIDKVESNPNYGLSIEILHEALNASREMFNKFNSKIVIHTFDDVSPYTFDDLVKNNSFAKEIYDPSVEGNIIDKLEILRNNFLSRYYYATNMEEINRDEKRNFGTSDSEKIISSITKKTSNNYSQNIFTCQNLCTDKFRAKDILDSINYTFITVQNIYNYLVENDQLDYVIEKIGPYQPIMSDKLSLFAELSRYLLNIGTNHFIGAPNLDDISLIAKKHGIDQTNYKNYFIEQILPKFNKENSMDKRTLLLNEKMYNDLDNFFLDNRSDSIKKAIIQDIFEQSYIDQNPILYKYFSMMDNHNYIYLYFFIDFAKNNSLQSLDIKNPLMSSGTCENVSPGDTLSRRLLRSGTGVPKIGDFGSILELMEYFIDHVCDSIMLPSVNDPTNADDYFGYGERFSSVIKNIYAKTNTSFLDNDDKINKIIGALSQSTDLKSFAQNVSNAKFQNSVSNSCLNKISNKSSIIDLHKEIAKKGVLLLIQQKNELNNFKNQLANILYRNKNAKCAWIKKLGHFLVKKVKIKCDDQIVDAHISDWFEVLHEVSVTNGKIDAYNKMVGNVTDLTTFDSSPKKSYTLAIPLVFYFNRYVSSSIPINSSINAQYEISVELRGIDEVSYKEQFSDFVDPTTLKKIIPKIKNAHLMAEYFYLSSEERRIFVINRLEYLMDELQYDDSFYISDSNLVPVYQIGTAKKTKTIFRNGKKIREERYDPASTFFMDKHQLQLLEYQPELIHRNDILVRPYKNRNGITYQMAGPEPLPIDKFVIRKRITQQHYFNHPTKFMAILIKPNIHTDPSLRADEKNYFYGERQWDNYGLYSYYNLSKIHSAKMSHFDSIKNRLNDLDDPIFGFINVINQLIFDYTDNRTKSALPGRLDKWINDNYDYFLQVLQNIKDGFMSNKNDIMNGTNLVQLKEHLVALNIDYNIVNKEILEHLISGIYSELEINSPRKNEINKIFPDNWISGNQFNICKMEFRVGILSLVHGYVRNDKLFVPNIDAVVNKIYQKYNESIINIIVKEINSIVDFNIVDYNFSSILNYLGYMCANNFPLSGYISQIKNKLLSMPQPERNLFAGRKSKRLTYKDIIQQITSHIPADMLNAITIKMLKKLNQLLENEHVEIINYDKNLIENPKINPLVSGYLKFNSVAIMPQNSDSKMWSEGQAYTYFNHTPSTGINLHSWSLDPLNWQPMGSVNLSRINEFKSVYDVHPLIGDSYPATITTMIMSINIMRYLSGMCAKAWEIVE